MRPRHSPYRPGARLPPTCSPIALLTTTVANRLLADPRSKAALLAVRGTNPPRTKPQAQSQIDNRRTFFLGLSDTLSWYIADNLPEAALQQPRPDPKPPAPLRLCTRSGI